MRFILFFSSIFMFCLAKSIMAVPMQVDELPKSVRQEHFFNSSRPYLSRESRVSGELKQTDIRYRKNQKLRNIKQQENPSEEVSLREAPPREVPLREVIVYFKTLLEPDLEVFANKVSSSSRSSEILYVGDTINPLSQFIDEFDELLKPYAIKVELFNALRNTFGDETLLALKESGEIVNLEPKLNTIVFDNSAVTNYNMGFVQHNTLARQRQGQSGEGVFSIRELIKKIINIISHPISIIMYLIFLFFVLPISLLIRRGYK